MAKRRELSIFNLSFLDIMSCGFGAVILIFVVINNASQELNANPKTELLAKIKKVEEEVEEEISKLREVSLAMKETDQQALDQQELIKQLTAVIASTNKQIASLTGTNQDEVAKLKEEIKKLEEETNLLQTSQSEEVAGGKDLYSFTGDGDRQYLTGLKVGGRHILILLDASASMLDKTIVNVIRTRNLSRERRIGSEKWQRAVRTGEWLIANLPRQASFQLYTFNESAKSVIPEQDAKWLSVQNRDNIEETVNYLNQIVPKGGTSLHHALAKANLLEPPPDNIFLIVDGLPTQGLNPPKSNVVSSQERNALFVDAISLTSGNIPINVILFPMEGDPLAAASYWRLAQITSGSFLAPSEDWP